MYGWRSAACWMIHVWSISIEVLNTSFSYSSRKSSEDTEPSFDTISVQTACVFWPFLSSNSSRYLFLCTWVPLTPFSRYTFALYGSVEGDVFIMIEDDALGATANKWAFRTGVDDPTESGHAPRLDARSIVFAFAWAFILDQICLLRPTAIGDSKGIPRRINNACHPNIPIPIERSLIAE